MPETRMIPVDKIDPPLRPMRISTLEEGLGELIADIEKNGQLQNVVVVETKDGRYRLVAGSRRCAAFEAACWPEIRASIYQLGEIDEANAMAAENFHRTQLSPVEEGHFYKDYMADQSLSVAEAARRTHRSTGYVRGLLDLIEGDPEVLEALQKGEINKGQAEQLNLVRDDIGRHQGLGWARQGLFTTKQLSQWREHREIYGISDSIEQVKENLIANMQIDYRTQAKCQIHQEYVDMVKAPPRIVCDDCWDLMLHAVEFYAANRPKEEGEVSNP